MVSAGDRVRTGRIKESQLGRIELIEVCTNNKKNQKTRLTSINCHEQQEQQEQQQQEAAAMGWNVGKEKESRARPAKPMKQSIEANHYTRILCFLSFFSLLVTASLRLIVL